MSRSAVARKNLEEEIAGLKRRPGKNVVVLSSPRLGQSLLAAGLVDELRLNVLPVVLGGGRRLFPETGARTSLLLTESRALSSGVRVLRYEYERAPELLTSSPRRPG